MKPTLALFAFFALSGFQAQGQISSVELARQLDETVPAILQKTGTPSASIAVVREARIAFLKAYGRSRLTPEAAAGSTLRYGIGSITKQFTAAALLLLVQDGKLTLDDKVSKYLPDIPNSNLVTIRELLSHTAGYRDDLPDNFVPVWMEKSTTPLGVLKQWAYAPLDFVPSTEFEYSNTDYIVAGLIIEKLSGTSFASFLESRIFHPLGMSSAIAISESVSSNVDVTGYFRYALGPPRPAIRQAPGWLFGGGELLMDAEDVAKWDISLINESLLKTSSYHAMESDTLLANGMATGYGLGLRLSEIRGHRRLEHAGEISGFYAENIQMPDDKVAVVVLTNMEVPTAATEIANGIVALLLREEQDSRDSKERLRKTLAGLKEGKIDRSQFTDDANAYFDDQALRDYQTSLASLGDIVSVSEQEPSHRAGQLFVNYSVKYASMTIEVRTAEDTRSKFAQFLIEPMQ